MAQIRNRFDIQNADLDEEMLLVKKLPNFFNDPDEIRPLDGILLSIFTHGIFACLFVALSLLNALVFPHLPKPELPNRDVEFKLVQNESKPPINKNTKIRSDRDSQAGGKHDPNKIVSEPSPNPKVQNKPAVAQTPQQQIKKPAPKLNEVAKTLTKQQPKVAQQAKPTPKVTPAPAPKVQPKVTPKPQPAPQPKVVQKPTPIKAPAAAKPSIKPAIKPGAPTPSAPKIATAPKSPFNIPTPPSKAPVGSTYRPAGTSSGSSASGTSSGSGNAPAPKFSSSGGSGAARGGNAGSGGSSYASRGSSGGSGSAGNPSPGNPNGRPGIDAIKQPNWGPYMRDLEQRIKRNWSPPKGDSSKRVVITFTIGRDGRLLSHKVTKSSGSPLADQAAMKAIELTAPFRPLPPEFKGVSVPIEFTFDYNVLNSVIR